jgi:hypothetical protein
MCLTLDHGIVAHRTRPMTHAHAEAFAAALRANRRFVVLAVERSPRAKSDVAYVVRYQPMNDTRLTAMMGAQAAARDRRAAEQAFVVTEGDGFFWVANPASGGVYQTTESSCDCGDQKWHACEGGCKHQRHLRALLAAGVIGQEPEPPAPVAPAAVAAAPTPDERQAELKAKLDWLHRLIDADAA